jgi:hypothetical protein
VTVDGFIHAIEQFITLRELSLVNLQLLMSNDAYYSLYILKHTL